MRFYFFRHSLKQTDGTLSPEGIALAEQVGAKHLQGSSINSVMVSSNPRTRQTASAMIQSPELMDFCPTMSALDSDRIGEWNDYIQESEGSLDPQHPLVAAEAVRMRDDLCPSDLRDDLCSLAIGHAGLLETLIYSLTGVMLKPLRECEGALVVMGDGMFTLVEELRR